MEKITNLNTEELPSVPTFEEIPEMDIVLLILQDDKEFSVLHRAKDKEELFWRDYEDGVVLTPDKVKHDYPNGCQMDIVAVKYNKK